MLCDAGSQDQKPGASCQASSECAGQSYCDVPAGDGPRVCVEVVTVGEGEACIGEKRGNSWGKSGDPVNNQAPVCDHDAGFYCASLATRVCAKRAQVGEACADFTDCVDGAYCKANVCEEQLPAGSTCSGFFDCNEAAYCADSTKTCEPRMEDGSPCGKSEECLSDYCDNGTCAFNALGGALLAFVCA